MEYKDIWCTMSFHIPYAEGETIEDAIRESFEGWDGELMGITIENYVE